MLKIRKNKIKTKTKRKIKNKTKKHKCILTDEAKRLIKDIKYLKNLNKNK